VVSLSNHDRTNREAGERPLVNLTILGVAISLAAGAPAVPATAAQPSTPELPLDAALEELDRQSLTVAQARARTEEAGGVARQVLAGVLPTVSAGASYVLYRDPAAFGLPGQPKVVFQATESWNVNAGTRVPLLVPNAWFDLAQARDAAAASRHGADAVRQQVRTGFAQAAYVAAAVEEVVAASQQAVGSAAELVRSAERRVAAGTAAPLDVLKARTEEVKRQSDLAGAVAELGRTRLGLGVLLGRETAVRVVVPELARAAPPELSAAPDALAATALEARPEIAAQRLQVAAAEQGVRSAWARLAPQLSAQGSLYASDVPYPTMKKDGWRASVDLTWPVYDGGFRYGKRRQAEAQLAGARAAEEAQRLGVVQEVQDARRDLELALEQLRLAEAQAQLAGDAAASAKRSFDAGVASSLDVIDANDRRCQADVGLARARARLSGARLALDRALGR
jgi:outer membrane protein TolC